MMVLLSMTVLALLLPAACSPNDSGIEGHITAGPACPVMQVDVPCPDQPYAGTLTILTVYGRIKIGEVAADASGYYRASLAPGTYILHPESPGILPSSPELTVTILPHTFTRQDIVYDTGIR